MRLEQVGTIRVFSEIRSDKSIDCPWLAALIAFVHKGDTLAIVRLNHLERSLAELLSTKTSSWE